MRRLLPVLVIVALIIAAVVAWSFMRSSEPATDEAAGAGAGGPPGAMALAVEAVILQPEALQRDLKTVGTLRADESVVVSPEVAGRIVKIHFEEGQPVAAGVPLFSLDDSVLRAALNEARANLSRAQSANARASELGKRQLIATADVDTTRADLAVAQARVASARAQLEKMTISAPFPGIAGLREVSVGAFVNPGQALVNLVRLDPIEVDFSLPESALGAIEPGQSLSIDVDAFPGETFRGTVSAIDPMIDVNSRSARLRAHVDNPGLRLRPGLFARIGLELGSGTRQALLLPEQALLQQDDTRFVYRIVEGKAVRTEVKTGQRVPGKVEIVSGLSAGDQVVVAGQSKPMMFDGAGVNVVGDTPDEPPQAPVRGG